MGPVYFYAVEPCLESTLGCFRKARDHVFDVEPAHGVRQGVGSPGHRVQLLGCRGAWRDRPVCRVHFRPGHAAAVKHLHDRNGTLLADCLHDGLPRLDLPLCDEAGLSGVPLGALVIRHDRFGVDDGRAVLRPSHQEFEHVPARDAVPGGGHACHGGYADPVLEPKILQLKGGKQLILAHSESPLYLCTYVAFGDVR